MYRFSDTPSGFRIPAILDESGLARPLHSTVNPVREAERLVRGDGDGEGFAVFLGLGGGFAPSLALGMPGNSGVLVIDYGLEGIAELFGAMDYAAVLGNPGFTLMVDPSPALVERAVAELYRPAISGGIRVLPLRARIERDRRNFAEAGEALRRGIERVSSDYSVQAHFGIRWFSNIVRNVVTLGSGAAPVRIASPSEAAICAAGPSLDERLPSLVRAKGRGGGPFVISTDTALPALLHAGLKPDAVVSIDCQHVGYHHFMGLSCRDVPLFLDVASPPALSALSDFPVFFCGGHPLAAHLRQNYPSLPVLDTSGGNVTYACLSLAEKLGAGRIYVYGADFSYPMGKIYARGTYVFPYFESRQNRLSPLEARISSFLFRAPFLPADPGDASAGILRCETAAMRSYRQSFLRKISEMDAEVSVSPAFIPGSRDGGGRVLDFAPGKPTAKAADFLEGYLREVLALSLPGPSGEKHVFTTLLPLMAALKHRRPGLSPPDLLEAAKLHCAGEIGRVLAAPGPAGQIDLRPVFGYNGANGGMPCSTVFSTTTCVNT